MVPGGGIEPPTRGFSIRCSTPELPGHSLRRRGFKKRPGEQMSGRYGVALREWQEGKGGIYRLLFIPWCPSPCARPILGRRAHRGRNSRHQTTAPNRDPCNAASRRVRIPRRAVSCRWGRGDWLCSLRDDLGLRRFERKGRIGLYPHFAPSAFGQLFKPFGLELGFERWVDGEE